MNYEHYVPGYGSSTAKLVIVGEAPGTDEDSQKKPFVGVAGDLLDDCIHAAGFDRSDTYITNVVKVRPPHNDLKKLPLIGCTIEEFIPQLIDELNTINPNCILCVGNTAFEVITGFTGISKYRGSILPSKITSHKTVSTLHPAGLLHNHGSQNEMLSWKDMALIRHDVKRAWEQAQFPEINSPPRSLQIARNSLDVWRFLNRFDGYDKASVDIETFKTIPSCIGIAFDKTTALSIPTLDDKIPEDDLIYIWQLLAEFLGDNKVKLIAQNGKFDTKRCRDVGLKWSNLWFDTMLAWHTLYAEMPKYLHTISSVLTEEPFYKEEGKGYNPKKDSFDRILKYNAKDAAVTYECFEVLMEQFGEEPEMGDFFFQKMMPLHQLYSDMEDVGILRDETVRLKLRTKYKEKLKCVEEKIVNLIIDGDESMRETFSRRTPKGLAVINSHPEVAKLLYGYLKCPVRKDTGEDTLKALANNTIKDERRKEIIKCVLEGRKIGKTIGTYIEARASEDGRIRTETKICGAETGRTSTKVRKAPIVVLQEGLALQTMTKHEDVNLDAGGGDLRSMFVADEGFSIFEPDQSQAEDRVVCVLAKDWGALEEYNRTSFTYNKHGLKDDRHTKTAMMVCSCEFELVTDYLRQTGKMVRHAGNLGIGKHELMLHLGGNGIYVSEWRSGRYLEEFHSANTNIRNVFHAGIEEALATNDRILHSPHGRKREFFNKWGSELFKEAYAFIPQATVTDQTKFALLEITKHFKGRYVFYPFLESHDSFSALVRDDCIEEVAEVTKREFERPIDFNKCTLSRDYQLVIPCEMKIGKRWIEKSDEFPDGMHKFKI